MVSEELLHDDLKIINELVYKKCSFELANLKIHSESIEYGACSFELNEKAVEFRASKVTPKKIGQFVTIWRRNKAGVTQPFDVKDMIDFIIVTSKNDGNIGQFIFPKSVLVDKGIISQDSKNGKRGIRVYPIWDVVTSKQALRTQSWQMKYFFVLKKDSSMDFNNVKELLNNK